MGCLTRDQGNRFTSSSDIEQRIPRGRTPQYLATTPGAPRVCPRAPGARRMGRENRSGWTGGHPCSLPPHSLGLPAPYHYLWLAVSPRQGPAL